MRIIVLQGLSKQGKTSTLNIVHEIILNHGGVSINRRGYGGDRNDFIDTVLYNNLRIGILSMGDQSTPIAKEIWNFYNHNCDLVICALSTGTPKVRANNALNHFNATRIQKTIAPNVNAELAVNTADAQTIFNLI